MKTNMRHKNPKNPQETSNADNASNTNGVPNQEATQHKKEDKEQNKEQNKEQDKEGTKGKEDVAKLKADIAKLKEQILRLLAEQDNQQKRFIKERAEAQKYINIGLARAILPLWDDLSRALKACKQESKKDEETIEKMIEGIEGIQKSFLSILKAHHIKIIAPKGEPFDPNIHEALFESPHKEMENGMILELLEEGFEMNGRLLRPAKVGIVKNP